MTDIRRTQIIRLLETRDDNLPEPVRDTATVAGFVHRNTARESCPDCLANGRTMKTCETCHGRGWVEVFREHDPYAIEKVQPYGIDRQRHERARERDRQIDRLDEQLAAPRKTEADLVAEANDHPYGWERARELMYDRFDYAALDRALDALRTADDGACHALHAVYVYGWLDYSAVMTAAVDRGLRFVDALMPDPIRAPGDDVAAPADAKEALWRGRTQRHERARDARRDRVLRAYLDWGWTTQQIAAHESLTDRRVRQIIADDRDQAGVRAVVATGPAA